MANPRDYFSRRGLNLTLVYMGIAGIVAGKWSTDRPGDVSLRSGFRAPSGGRRMRAMSQQWADYRVFWREFRRSFHTTGAVLPSGPALAAALSRYVREGSAGANSRRRILEVGPGTGAVTRHILAGLRPEDRLDLVERNAEFVACLKERIANDADYQPAAGRIALHHASVEELSEAEPYDVIVSGLPLNNFSIELVEQMLAKLAAAARAARHAEFFRVRGHSASQGDAEPAGGARAAERNRAIARRHVGGA